MKIMKVSLTLLLFPTLFIPFFVSAKTVTVERVIDGDTFVTIDDEHIRLIGVDTPELDSDDCYSQKAKTFLEDKILGKNVRLDYDEDRKDSFGRTLAYVYQGDSFINKKILKQGYGTVLSISPNTQFEDSFSTLQENAQQDLKGLWSHCDDIIADYLPSKVKDVSVSNVSTDSAVVSWDEAELARTYQVFYRESTETDWTVITGIKETNYTLEGLDDGADYDLKVLGKNYLGKGSKSSLVEFTTDEEDQEAITALSLDISVSDATPSQNSDVDILVTVTDQLGRPVEGATGSATAHYKSTDTTNTFSTSNSNGDMTATFGIGRATLGYEVVVEVSISYEGLTGKDPIF
ncbi:MAG: thermonuclease family protein [Patescibacteria group bacterium]